MAVNLSSYIKNLGKSVGYSAVDKVKKMNPTIESLVDANKDLTKDLYKNVKDYKSIVKNIPKTIRENEYYRIADQGIKNTLSDLKTGKFYNKERKDKTDLKMMGMDESSLDSDFDINLDDDDFGLNDLDLDSIGDDDLFLANEMDEVGSKVSNAISNATIESASYLANVNKASTKMLIDQNNRMMNQITVGMGAVNTSIQQLVQFQENVQVHIENSTTFYTTIGEKVDTTNKLLTEILELQKKNSDADMSREERKSKTIRYSDIDDGMGGVDLKLYAKSIKKRLNAHSGGIFDTLNMFSGGNMLETFIASPLQFITDKLVDKLVSKSIEKANENLDASLKGLFGSFMTKLNDKANNSDGLVQKIAEIFGVNNTLKKSIDTSQYKKGAMPWNGKANKALTEVIPTQLSEIISLLDGQSQRLFDYESGKFTTREKIKIEKDSEFRREATGAARDVMEELRGMMSKMSFDSKKDKETLMKEMANMFVAMFNEGTFLDIYDKDFDLPGVSDPKAKRYLRSMLKNVTGNKMLNLNTNMMSKRDNYTKKMMERELSGTSNYNYLEDGFNSTHLSYKEKNGRKEIDMSKDKSLLSKLSIDRIKDNKGHTLFYYLQNINSELTYMRSNGGMGGGSGSPANAYYSPSGVRYLPPVYRDSIEDVSESYKNAKRDTQREIEEYRRYEESKRKQRETTPSLLKTEEIDSLEDLEFDRAITSAANEYKSDKNIYNRRFNGPKSLIDSLLEAKTISEKSKVIVQNIKDISSQPSQLIASAMDSADRALYTIIYGDKRDKDGKRKSFLNEMIEQMKLQFTRVNTWIDNAILNPMKEKMGVESFRDVPKKIFAMFGIDIDETFKSFKEYIFGRYEIDGNGRKVRTQDGLLTPIAKGIEEAFDDFGKFLDEALEPVLGPIKNKFKGTKVEEVQQQEVELPVNSTSNVANNASNSLINQSHINPVKNKKRDYRNKLNSVDPSLVNGSNSYNLAGGYLEKIDYKNIKKKIARLNQINRQSGYSARSVKTQLAALVLESEKYTTFSNIFSEILGDKKEGARAAELLLTKVGSRDEDVLEMTLDQIYEELQDLGSFSYITNKGKELKFSSTYKGKQLVKGFNKFANESSMFDIDHRHASRNTSKIKDIYKGVRGLDLKNLSNQLEFPAASTREVAESHQLSRETIQSNIEAAFSSIDKDINNSNNGVVKELKNIHHTIKSILRHMSGENITLPGEDGFIGPLNLAEGGVINYPEDTVVPALLSGGEIVINPADKKTRKKQGERERKVRDLFRKGKIQLYSEGTNNVQPLEETTEKINGRKHKVSTFDGKKYIRKGSHYYSVDEVLEKGSIHGVTEYYYSADEKKMVPVGKLKKGSYKETVKKVKNGEYVEGEEPLVYRMVQTASNGLNSTAQALGITKEDSTKFNKAVGDVMENISEYAPAAIGSGLIGSGVSLITGAIGGPLLGAAAGAAIGLVRKSSQVQSWLFGDQDENGEYSGGFLSKDLSNNIHKYLPGMAKSATLGGILSVLPFVPGGPIAGIMIGSAVGYAKNNEEFMSTIFGENYKDNIGSFKEKLNKKLPHLVLGAAGGALFGPLGGIIPNIMLGSAVGFATSTDKFNTMLFGELQEDGTREGGILNAVKVGIVDPIKENGKNLWDNITSWVHDDIIIPIKDSIDPLFKQSTLFINKVFGGLMDKIGNTFDKGMSYVIGNFLRTEIFNPIINRGTKLASLMFSPAKNAISLPFRAVGKIGDHFRQRQVAGGNATYMTAQERLDYRNSKRQKKHNSLLGRFGTGINKVFDTESNPLSRFITNSRAIRRDKFEDFDQFLVNAKDEELGQMKEQFDFISDTEGYLKKEQADSLAEQRKALYHNNYLDWNEARNIEEALEVGDYERAKHLLDGVDMDELDRQKLSNKIFSAGARFNSVKQAAENLKTGKIDALNALRHHKSGVFKGLKSGKDITKYQDYLTNEIKNRQKSDVEKQTDQQKEQHREIMGILDKATTYLKLIADPDPEKRKAWLQQLENAERKKAAQAANTKAGLFGNFGVRDSNARVFDFRRDENGNMVTDDAGNPIYDYVGYGTMEHANRNMDLYKTRQDENGNTVLDLDRNGRPQLLSNIKTTKANVFNTLHMSRNKKKDLYDKYSTRYTVEDMIQYNSTNNSDLKEYLQSYMKKYNIVDVNLDNEMTQTMTENQAKALLGRLNFTNWTRTDREELYSHLNHNNIVNSLMKQGYSRDAAINMMINRDREDDTRKKKKWYMFDGPRRYRLKNDSDGNPIIDTEDAETSENIEDKNKIEKINEDTKSAIVSLKDSTIGFFKRFLGFADYRDSDRETIFDKIKKVTGGVMGAWTLLSFGPYVKKFWVETAAPYLGKVFSPVAPAIERVALKLDNFFLNTVPNTLKDIGNKIIWWLSGTGEYSDKGLPGVFRDHIIPFYMGGLEFLTEDIVPTIFKYLPSVLTSVAKGAVKTLSNILTTNIASIFRGEVPTLENTKDDIKNTLDNGVFSSNTKSHKTGPFYSLYRTMFGGSSNNTSTLSPKTVSFESTSNSTSNISPNNATIIKIKNDTVEENTNKSTNKVAQQQIQNYNENVKYTNEITSAEDTERENTSMIEDYINIITGNAVPEEYIKKYIGGLEAYSNSYEEDPLGENDYSVQPQATDYSRILYSTNAGEAVYDTDGNLIYNNGDNTLTKQDAEGNLYQITPTATDTTNTDTTSINTSPTKKISEYMTDAVKSLTQVGTVGGAVSRSFVTGNAGLATMISEKIAANGGKLIQADGFIKKALAYPVNTFTKYSTDMITGAAKAGNATRNFIMQNGHSVNLASVIDDDVTRKLLEVGGNGTRLTIGNWEDIATSGKNAATDYLKNIGKSEEYIASHVGKIEEKVSKAITRNISEETGEVAIKSSVRGKMSQILSNSKIGSIIKSAFGETAFPKLQQRLLSASDDIADTLFLRLKTKVASKSAQFIGKLTPAALVFIGLDFARGWTNAQANLGILRTPSFLERLVSAMITVINGYITLGLIPETFIYKIVIETLSPFSKALEGLEEEREAARQEVAAYNSKHGTTYTVAEYTTKDRTGLIKFLFGGGEQEVTTKMTSAMNVALVNAVNTDDKSYIIGGSLSQAQLQYAEDNGLYASGSGLPATGSTIDFSNNNFTFTKDNSDVDNKIDFSTGTFKFSNTNNSFISQNDPTISTIRFNTKLDTAYQTIGTSGCVPSVAAMMVSDIKHPKDTNNITYNPFDTKNYLTDAVNMAKTPEYKEKNGGVKTSFIKDYLKKYDIESDQYKNSKLTTWLNKVENGTEVAAIGKDPNNKDKSISPFGPHSHAVKIRGIVKDRNNSNNDMLVVDDPEQSKAGVLYKKSTIFDKIQEVIVPRVSTSTKSIANKTNNSSDTKKKGMSKESESLYTMYNDESMAMQFADLCTFSTISRSTFKKALNKLIKGQKDSVFKKMSDIFLIASKETGFDPRFLLALALYMTDYGTNKFATTYKNPFKIKNANKKYVKFKDLEDGIIEGAKYIKTQIYLNGQRYCLRQMAISTDQEREYAGQAVLSLSVSEVPSVVAIMISDEMPDNTKFASYSEGPTDTTGPSATITGEKVYNKDDGVINSISDLTGVFSKLMNAILGFGTDDDPYGLNDLQDSDEGDSTMHENGHSFLCYCQECHPEMYDANGNPITSQALSYVMTQKATRNAFEGKDAMLAKATKNVANQIYDTLVEQLGFSKNLDPIKLVQSEINYQNSPTLADKMTKFTIMASEDSTVPGIKLVGADKMGKTSSGSINSKFYNTNDYLTLNKENINLDYSSLDKKDNTDKTGIGIDESGYLVNYSKQVDTTDYKAIYKSLVWYYRDKFGTEYSPKNPLNSQSDYKNEVKTMKSDLYSRFKIYDSDDTKLFNYLTGKLGDSKVKLGYDIDLYNSKKRSILEKTDTFNPSYMMKNSSKLRLYPVIRSDQERPLYYLAESENLQSGKNAFKTSLLGVPVYGMNTRTTNSLTDAWNSGSNIFTSALNRTGKFLKHTGNYFVNGIRGFVGKLTGDNELVDSATNSLANSYSNTYDITAKSWGDLSTQDIVETYGLTKASNILDQYNAIQTTEETGASTDSDTVSGVVKDNTTSNKTIAYMYDQYGNLVEYELDETDLANYNNINSQTQTTDYSDYSAQGSGLKLKSGRGSFVSQLDPRYSNMRFNTSKDTQVQTVGEAGCAPAVATMAINNYLGNGTSMEAMTNNALNYKVKNGGTSSDYFEDVFAQNGISSSYTQNISDMAKSLRNGQSVVLLGQDSSNTSKSNSPFGPGDHYVLANGISKDGRTIYVNDPELNQENVPYSSKILDSANLGISVGGASKLIKSRLSGSGSYTKETASINELRSRNLGQFSAVTAEQLNAWINSKCSKSSLMYNSGKYFIKASNESGLDPRYLVAHAASETGWGTSRICRNKFNFFGIAAFDASPYASASKWGGVEQGIVQGAVWISKHYYAKGQTTLYTMRHNNGSHEYATDPKWDSTIASIMKNGPINTEGTSVKSVLAKAKASSTTSSSSSSSSNSSSSNESGDVKYSSIGDMISSVFSGLSDAIFGFSSNSDTAEEAVGSDYESAGTVTEESLSADDTSSNKIRYINQSTSLYKNKTEPISGAPEASKHVIMSLSYGTKVKLVTSDSSTGVSQIKKSGKVGYVKTAYLQTTKPDPSKGTNVYKYIKQSTKMYKYKTEPISSAPEASKHIVASLTYGAKVEIVKNEGDVCKVKKSGKTGYVKSSLLQNTKPIANGISTRYATVKTNMYKYKTEPISSAPEASKHLIRTLNKGTKVNLVKNYGDVSKIKKSGKTGYVKSNYLSTKNPNAKTTTSSNSSSTLKPVPGPAPVYPSGSGSGLSSFTNANRIYNSIYTGRGSNTNIPKSNFNGKGIEEILKPFTSFGKVFGFDSSSSSSSSTSNSSSSSSTVKRSALSKKYKSFTLTNNSSALGEKIVKEAKKHLGKPYVWGATGPNSFDCSGLCKYVYAKCGINLKNRQSAAMAKDSQGKVVTKASVGDLLFFGSSLNGVHHVGIYIGDGQYIHAPKRNDVVKIANVSGRNDLVRIKHYTAGKGSELPLLNKLKEMNSEQIIESDNILHDYMETLSGNGSGIINRQQTVKPATRKEVVYEKSSGSGASLDNETILELVKLCCKYMAKTADNTDSMKDVVKLLTKLVDAKTDTKKNKGNGSTTIKVESSGKGSSSTNTVVINKDNSSSEDTSTRQLVELLSKLASD